MLEIGRVNRRTAIFDCRLQPRGNPIAFLGQFFERHSWWSHSHAPILTLTGFCLQSQWPLRRMGRMGVQAKCSGCGKVVKGRDDWAGRAAKCPGCGAAIEFPATAPPKPVPDPLDAIVAEEARVAALVESVAEERAARPWPPTSSQPMAPASGPTQVVVTSIKLSLWNMVELMVGFTIAAFLAGILLAFAGAMLAGVLAGLAANH
jgi:hypothetical protein